MLKPRKRLTKKQLKEDKLLTTLVKIQSYFELEWKRLAITAGAAAVIVLLAVYFINLNRSREQEAASKLYELEFRYMNNLIFNDTVARALETFIDEYSDTDSGARAVFYLGNTYYQLGKYQEAEKNFQRYLDDYDGPDFLRSSALSGIAASYEQRQLFAEASEYYVRSVNEYPDSFLLPENLLGAARNLAFAGKKESAITQCKRLIDSFPTTKEAREAEILLARL